MSRPPTGSRITRRLHPNRHASHWRNTDRWPIECPGHCHQGELYHGHPADPNTDTEPCLECDGGRIQWYRNAAGEREMGRA